MQVSDSEKGLWALQACALCPANFVCLRTSNLALSASPLDMGHLALLLCVSICG